MIEWHHLLGTGLSDSFSGSCYKVVIEKELSLKKQKLDLLIIEQESGPPVSEVPDGLENLVRHNLITYKSVRQPLDAWALDELIGHYVNYRKQISPSFDELLPLEDFGLYAVSTRHPQKLEAEVALQPIKEGVFQFRWGGRVIRLIVLSEVEQIARNKLWLMFSGVTEKVQYAFSQFKFRQQELRPLFKTLVDSYRLEGITMSITVEDVKREIRRDLLASFTTEEILQEVRPEELLEKLPPEVLLKKLSPEERLKGLPPEERLKGLPPEERLKGLPPEERLKGLSQKQIEAYLKKLAAAKRARKR